jgi:hypothetical protein
MTDIDRRGSSYEPPRLLRLAPTGDAAADACTPGSTAAGDCISSGASATLPGACSGTGGTAFGACTSNGGAPTSQGCFSEGSFNI